MKGMTTAVMNREIIKKLQSIVDSSRVYTDAHMDKYTSFRAGGRAAVLVEPESAEELKLILRMLDEAECPHMVLGNGSNVLVKDSGYDGVIVRIGKAFSSIRIDGEHVVCGSGALMSAVAKAALDESLTGFEFASGIPGSIGGAVFMNAGAYGGEIKDILEDVRLVSADGTRDFCMSAEDLKMGYRHSLIQETGDIVVEARLRLARGDMDAIREEMAELTSRRNSKQPVQYPSAGSTFKRPEGYFAGKLIQDAGCKGLQIGGAQVSELHSGFIINKDNATATDILQLMEVVAAKVYNDFGVQLEPEVRIIG